MGKFTRWIKEKCNKNLGVKLNDDKLDFYERAEKYQDILGEEDFRKYILKSLILKIINNRGFLFT